MSHERSLARRKRWFEWLQRASFACALLLIPALARAQTVTFTKVTTGGIVNTAATYWGGSWGDYDDDGWLDLFVAASILSTTNFLYHNDHDGTFTRIPDAAMPKSTSSDQHGSAWADYDNDGHLDLIVTLDASPLFVGGLMHNALYHNNGNGTFSGTTNNAIYNDFYYLWAGSHAPKWGDYNNDGLIDLFIAGHDVFNRLFRNDGGGAFTRMTNHVLVNDLSNSEGGAWIDYDNDGDLDLFVANAFSTYSNALYRNDQSGVFTKTTNSGLSASVEDSIASCWADYDNDGFLDLFLANEVKNSLHHNNGDGTFFKVLDSALVQDSVPSPDYFFGTCAWADYDNDGALDLYFVSATPFIAGDAFLYHNAGDGTFTKVTDNAIITGNNVGFPSWVDYDNDGFMDLFLAVGAFDPVPHTNMLFHNDGNANAWLNVKLVGTVSNRSAIGAKVRVNALFGGASHWQLREISGGEGQNIQPSLNAEFGLADATTIDTLRVEWPSGIVQEFHDFPPRQFLTITESAVGIDTDGDGILDPIDNCPTVANVDQADGDGDLDGDVCDNCAAVANPDQTNSDGDTLGNACDNCPSLTNESQDDTDSGGADGVGDACDNCPTVANADQADGGVGPSLFETPPDGVGNGCDNCVNVNNPRVAASFLTANPWATLTGEQRDDDHDGYGNKCDAKFVGNPSQSVGGLDLGQFRASNNEDRRFDTCGTSNTRPCAIFDLDEAAAGNAIGGLDLGRFRQLNNATPGPRCEACTRTGSVPLACTAGTAGSCN